MTTVDRTRARWCHHEVPRSLGSSRLPSWRAHIADSIHYSMRTISFVWYGTVSTAAGCSSALDYVICVLRICFRFRIPTPGTTALFPDPSSIYTTWHHIMT